MRVLVLGASGFVGSSLLRRLVAGGHDAVGTYRRRHPDVTGAELVHLDMTDERAATDVVEGADADAIVSLVAESDPRKAETDEAREVAASVRRSLGAVAAECKRAERHLTFVSSDYVFDFRSGPYAETDPLSPSGEYGRDKALSEELVMSSGAPAAVVRTSLVYGWAEPGVHPNYVHRVVDSIRAGERVDAHADVTRTPIYVGDLADALIALMRAGKTGIHHAGSSDVITMSDLALEACRVFGLDQQLVAPCAAAEVDPSRPRNGGLKTQKFAAELGRPLPTTKEGISRMKEEEPRHA